MELLVEVGDEFGMDEVDEGIANVAVVVVVNGQIEKVEFHFVLFEFLEQEFLRILVRDVSDHEGGAAII